MDQQYRMELHLLGRPFINNGNCQVGNFLSRKSGELFCYLMLLGKDGIARERLAGTLWSTSTISQSMKHLRQALWQLISFLDKGFGGLGSRMLCVDQHWVHMNGLPDVWVDLTQFERAYATIHSLPIQHWDPQELGVINNALSLYVGELLEGCYEDWCLLERQRLHDMHLVMLDKLVEYCEQQQDLEGVLEYAARILRFDATHEQAHWHLMRALYLRGDRTAALRQYERCVNRLKTEFGADPSKKIRALYRQICADELDTPYQVYRLDSYSSPLPLPLAL